MSMNLAIIVEKPMLDLTTNEKFIFEEYLDIYQTPTDITRKLIQMDDPFEGYKEFVLEISDDEFDKVYHNPEDEFLVMAGYKEDDPSLYKIIVTNFDKEHITELENIINDRKKAGYTISYKMC